MSLRLLLDEDSQAKKLVTLLQEAGYDIVTVNQAGLMGKADAIVLDFARQEGRILLTRNCHDFFNLHAANSSHPGILAIYEYPNPAKNLSYAMIVKAIANIEAAGIELNQQFIPINQWNY